MAMANEGTQQTKAFLKTILNITTSGSNWHLLTLYCGLHTAQITLQFPFFFFFFHKNPMNYCFYLLRVGVAKLLQAASPTVLLILLLLQLSLYSTYHHLILYILLYCCCLLLSLPLQPPSTRVGAPKGTGVFSCVRCRSPGMEYAPTKY